MTEWLLSLVPAYGPWLILVATFASCLGLPVPGSLVLLAGGSFAASGDLTLAVAAAAGLVGAVAGDQAGYWIGARAGDRALALAQRRGMGGALARADALAVRWGGAGVFLTRWLLAPFGPALNIVVGTLGMPWLRFSLFEVAGEVVWVVLYVGMGFVFSRSILEIAEVAGNLVWFLVAGLVALVLAQRLFAALRAHRRVGGRRTDP